MRSMSQGVDRFASNARRSMQRVGRVVGRVGTAMTAALGVAVGLVSREFVNFDQAITDASAKFSDFNAATAEGQARMRELQLVARQVGAQTKFTATEAAEGLDFLAMAGFNSVQAMAALPGVANLATVAKTDLATATDMASDALGAFGLMTEDATQLQQNFTRVNDVMARTVSTANTDMTQLFESMQKGAPSFTAAGQSLETFSALAGIMANSGVKGAEAGTQLRNVMLRLADPTAESAETLRRLGVVTQDEQGNFRDVVDILADFERGLEGMGTAQRSAALATVFGARSVTGINLLLQEGTGSIRSYRDELLNAAGASQEMADTMNRGLLNRLAALKSAAIEIGFQFMDRIGNQAGDAIDTLTEKVRNINVEAILNRITDTVQFFVRMWENGLIPAVLTGIGVFIALQKAVAAYQLVMIAVSAAQKAAAVSGGLLNAVMAANPIGLVIIAIAALIAIIVLLVRNWDKVIAFFGRGWDAIKNATGAALGWIRNAWDSAIGWIVNAWRSAVEWVSNGITQIWDWFTGLLDNPLFAALGTLFAPFLAIPAMIVEHWEPIKEFFENLFGGIRDVVGGAIEWIGDAARGVGDFFGGLFDGGRGRDDRGGDAPMSPNASIIESRRIEQQQSTMDINFNGLPRGTRVRQQGSAPNINTNLGFAAGAQ
ncbi:MAG: phage tail tape measure protein [Spirochaetota bacterium]